MKRERSSLEYWLHRWAIGDRAGVAYFINEKLNKLGGMAGVW